MPIRDGDTLQDSPAQVSGESTNSDPAMEINVSFILNKMVTLFLLDNICLAIIHQSKSRKLAINARW